MSGREHAAMSAEAEHLFNCGASLYRKGLVLAARDCWETALSLLPEPPPRPLATRLCNALGTLLLELRRPEEALAHFSKADRYQQELPPAEQDRAAGLYNMALAYLRMGEADNALPLATLAAELCPDTKEKRPLIASISLVTGLSLMNNDSWPEAEKWMQKAMSSFRSIPDRKGEAICLNNLGIIAMESGDYHRSEELLKAALERLVSWHDAGLAAYTHSELGRLYFKQGGISAALHHGSAALRILWDNMGLMDRAEVARLCFLFGSIFSHTGDREAAMGYMQRASTYFAQSQMWREWSRATQELDALIKRRHKQQFSRAAVAFEDKELLRFLTTLMGLMDTLESLYPDMARTTGLISRYSLLLGRASGLGDEELARLSYAARLRDVGLTSESEAATEREMSGGGHPVMSERILAMFGVPQEIRRIVRHHHENYDGSGFPDGLMGEEIPLGARIVALSERYVLKLEREVAKGTGYHARTIELMNEERKHIDPLLLDLLSNLHHDYRIHPAQG
ncbi:MAG TPA: tetratricopeptide repeat protein [Firmicutes bacterium]|nr:tetratricopeptide repeat protein [Bacillota bacterium]